MKMRHLMLIPSVLLFSQLSICSLAQAKTIYQCESYTRLDGTSAFRVSPSISGSFTGPYLMGGRVSVQSCFVPVTKKQCFYKLNEPGLTPHRWHKCGETWVNGFRFKTDMGNGEIVEDKNGKKYHV
ncbi:MAG: hypothetical protein ACKPAE_02330, partial [Microcystis panniformis]